LVFYGARLSGAGPERSNVAFAAGAVHSIPNALVIAVPAKASAAVGDIVLTDWGRGAGMQRAIVVGAEDPFSPKVRYLDLPFLHPSGHAELEDTLPPASFRRVEKAGDVGSTAVCRQGAKRTRQLVIRPLDDGFVGYSFSRRVSVWHKQQCEWLDVRRQRLPGERVSVPVMGRYSPARLVKVDAPSGTAQAEHTARGEKREETFALVDIADPDASGPSLASSKP
jgi:hypothetical protein